MTDRYTYQDLKSNNELVDKIQNHDSSILSIFTPVDMILIVSGILYVCVWLFGKKKMNRYRHKQYFHEALGVWNPITKR